MFLARRQWGDLDRTNPFLLQLDFITCGLFNFSSDTVSNQCFNLYLGTGRGQDQHAEDDEKMYPAVHRSSTSRLNIVNINL